MATKIPRNPISGFSCFHPLYVASQTGDIMLRLNKSSRGSVFHFFLFSILVSCATQMHAQWTQQGIPLSWPEEGVASFGSSLAISADGNTAIVGSPANNKVGWVYRRNGEIWTQPGIRLYVTSYGATNLGISGALSADGNTALLGGDGAVVFTRSGNTWTQQGSALVGTGCVGGPGFGLSVALSANGNTAVIGCPADNNQMGAILIFARSSNVWSQQGSKLVGTGSIGTGAGQGSSVGISSDGNTALSGGPLDGNGWEGAVWVFTRSGNTWSQQGNKLVPTDNIGASFMGTSISLSADGNTAAFGGSRDNNHLGAVWVFTRNGNTWSQQSKLVGTGGIGHIVWQGSSVSLSSDGSKLISGGPRDNTTVATATGAAWIFSRTGTVWNQDGNKLVSELASDRDEQGRAVAMSPDGARVLIGGPGAVGYRGLVWA